MSKRVEEQLQKTNLLIYSTDKENVYYIPKQNKPEPLSLKVNHYYMIELADYIVHPYEGFTLQDNWNKGVIPKSHVLKCMVKMIMGKMVKIDGSGFDRTNNRDKEDIYYDLWLPINSVTILEEI